MQINFTLNGVAKSLEIAAGENAFKLLKRLGIRSVRLGDDGEGFAGVDAIRLNGRIVNSSLLLAAQLDNGRVETAEHLNKPHALHPIQQALVDTGAVQSGYTESTVALLLADLMERNPNASRSDVREALSGLFSRDNGYQQFFEAFELAQARLQNPQQQADCESHCGDNYRLVGRPGDKVDVMRVLRAEPAFVEDHVPANSLIAKVLRSPHAHAYIKSLDCSAAEVMPGVHLVLSYKNTPQLSYTPGGQSYPEPSPYDRQMFGRKMRHYGDRVCAVVAETEEQAEAALKAIKVEFDVLKPVMGLDDAMAEDAPIVHNGPVSYAVGAPENLDEINAACDERDGPVFYHFPIGADIRRNQAFSHGGEAGDPDQGFADADAVIERTYESTQVMSSPVEPHTCVAWVENERLICRSATQTPWHLRRQLGRILDIRENQIQVIKERVGGGYGAKQDMILEEIASYAAWQLSRPVFMRYSRKEVFNSSATRHVFRIRVKLGAKKDGKLTAIEMDIKANTGPYGNHCLTVPSVCGALTLSLFPCDNLRVHASSYYSNISPTGAYQGYGAPKGHFAMHLAIAELAQQLGLDPLDMLDMNRTRVGVRPKIMQVMGEGDTSAEPAPVGSCGLDEIISEGRKLIGWDQPKPADEGDWVFGRGVGLMQQGSGIPGLDQSNSRIKLASDGTFILHSGGADLGTGLDTVMAKLAAETLGCDLEDVYVNSGDTDAGAFDTGAYASSGTYFSGAAALNAANKLKGEMLQAAATLLKEPVSDLKIEYPRAVVGKKGKLSFLELARYAESGSGCGQLQAAATHVTHDPAYPFGANFCELKVNKRTGQVKLLRYIALLDCGTAINPDQVKGQIYGGTLRAIGHALSEELLFDAEGRCLNADLQGYGIPMVGDVPEEYQAILIDAPDSNGPMGAKSASEINVNGAAPAIALALNDALGIWLNRWRFSPEAILRAMGKVE